MAERYTRLFSLPEDLYAEGAPVLVAAGALLRDNTTDTVLAQLKLKNIGEREICAVTVIIHSFDPAGRPIGNSVHHAYLDLRVRRDGEFGQKNLASLPDKTARSYTVAVTEVVFADGTIWTGADTPWEPLEKQQTLAEYLGDIQLAEQYDIEVGKPYGLAPMEQSGLWFCACGAINRESETVCHLCKSERAKIFGAVNRDILKDRLNARLTRESEKKRRILHVAKRTAIVALSAVAACVACALLITKLIIPSVRYNNAVELMDNGEYESAIAAFEAMGDYRDSEEQILNCRYDQALGFVNDGKYENAIAILETIDGYKDSTNQIEICKSLIEQAEKGAEYAEAINLMEDGKYESAVAVLKTLVGYENSETLLEDALVEIYGSDVCSMVKNAEVGGTITFGTLEQDNNTTVDGANLEWIVLEKNGWEMLIITKDAMGNTAYNDTEEGVTWESCTLRTWLNDTFLNTVFSENEKDIIEYSLLTTDEYSVIDGNDTEDRIFLLSTEEAREYFQNDNERKCVLNNNSSGESCEWWLRSLGVNNHNASYVDEYGAVCNTGFPVYLSVLAVRPAMRISLW